MKNLIKSLKIQWKHKRIWLLLFLIPFIGISMDELSSKIDEEIWLLSNLYEDKLMVAESIDPDYFIQSPKIDKRRGIFKKEGIKKEDMRLMKDTLLKIEKIPTMAKQMDRTFFEDHNLINGEDGSFKINGSKLIFQSTNSFTSIIFLASLAILLNSLEGVGSFYKFSRSLTGKVRNDYLSKLFIGFIFCLGYLVLVYKICHLQLTHSSLKEVLIFEDLTKYYIFGFLRSFSIFSIAYAIGQLSNFILGQVILCTFALGGIIPWYNNLKWTLVSFLSQEEYQSLFQDGVRALSGTSNQPFKHLVMKVLLFLENLYMDLISYDPLVQGMIDPTLDSNAIHYDYSFLQFESSYIIGNLLLACVLLILGLFWHKKGRFERKAGLILSSFSSKILIWIFSALVSLLLYNWVYFFLSPPTPPWLGLLAFIINITLSYKFFYFIFIERGSKKKMHMIL